MEGRKGRTVLLSGGGRERGKEGGTWRPHDQWSDEHDTNCSCIYVCNPFLPRFIFLSSAFHSLTSPSLSLFPSLPASLPPPLSLDKLYTLTDDGFREVTILHDEEEESNLPPCFPSTYGDEFEQRLLEEQEAGVDVKNYAP